MNVLRNTVSRRRGSAMVAAISILAILTILLVGLAAVQRGAMISNAKVQSAQQAHRVARLAFDAAWAAFSKIPGGLAQPVPLKKYLADPDSFGLAASLPKEDDPIYAGHFLKQRPGDILLGISASTRRLRIEQLYLINTNPAHLRRICLKEEVKAAEPAKTP